ncbi:hypothetical protein HK405_007385 [Cladochytrium tenue]|nr:hypothetical protein HK405_007385 [Cladochytrium tenue]
MHLFFENVIPLLIELWGGKDGSRHQTTHNTTLSMSLVSKADWVSIGHETKAANSTLPSSLTPNFPDIYQHGSSYTADQHMKWFLYISPAVMHGRLPEQHYKHMMQLVRLIWLNMQDSISRPELEEMRDGFAKWVKQYEKLYYGYKAERLHACRAVIHSLLHVADNVEQLGPMWAYWNFPTERFCGKLGRAVKSRRHPWTNLLNHLLIEASIQMVGLVCGQPPIPESHRKQPLHLLSPLHKTGILRGRLGTHCITKKHHKDVIQLAAFHLQCSVKDAKTVTAHGQPMTLIVATIEKLIRKAGTTFKPGLGLHPFKSKTEGTTIVSVDSIYSLCGRVPLAGGGWHLVDTCPYAKLEEGSEEGSKDDSEVEESTIMDGDGQHAETDDEEEEEDAESLGVEDDIDMDGDEDEEEEGVRGNYEVDRWYVEEDGMEEELEEEEEEGVEEEETVRVDELEVEDGEEEESEMEEPLPRKRHK